jgi:hypothetical protein
MHGFLSKFARQAYILYISLVKTRDSNEDGCEFFFVDKGSVEQIMQQNAPPSADYLYNHSLKFSNGKFSLLECVINKITQNYLWTSGIIKSRVHNRTSIISSIPGSLSKKVL